MFWYLVLILASVTLGATENHKVFRITPKSEEQLQVLQSFQKDNVECFNYWRDPSVVDNEVDLMVAPEKIDKFVEIMHTNDIQYEAMIENVEALLSSEARNKTLLRSGGFSWTSYHNLEEIYDWLDQLAYSFPGNVRVIAGGRTHEGRAIKGVKLSFGSSDRPGVFIEGGIHAREWISHATVTYLINQFLTSREPRVRQLAEAHDWYIFPVFNPDGYAYTHANPSNTRYRFWRKTRSPSKTTFPFSSCYGTDMNRNWGFQWMSVGASNNPCSEAYAGSRAFSEIETATLSNYIRSISDKLFAYLAFHSYSQFLMFPYGHTRSHLDNYREQYEIGLTGVAALSRRYGTYYKTGTIAEVIGYASGGSVDWVKSELKLPMVFVYELRDKGNSGFLLPANQIVPTGEEVLDSLVAMFSKAKTFAYPSN